MALEQQALQEEINVYGRQETRDIAQLNRLAAQQQNAEQRAIDFQAGGQAALMAGVQGFASSAGVAAGGFSQLGGGPQALAPMTPRPAQTIQVNNPMPQLRTLN